MVLSSDLNRRSIHLESSEEQMATQVAYLRDLVRLILLSFVVNYCQNVFVAFDIRPLC